MQSWAPWCASLARPICAFRVLTCFENFDEDAEVAIGFCASCRGGVTRKEQHLNVFGNRYHMQHFNVRCALLCVVAPWSCSLADRLLVAVSYVI